MGRSKDDLKWQRKSEEFRKAAGVEQDFLKLLPALPYENRLSSDSVWYKLWYKQKKKKKKKSIGETRNRLFPAYRQHSKVDP